MKNCILTTLALLLAFSAAAFDGNAGGCINAGAVYGYNNSWKSFGGANLGAEYSFCNYFEAAAAAEFTSPGVFAVGVDARPKIALGIGEIFLDAAFHYKGYSVYESSDMALALSVGYRMNYLKAQFGIMGHRIGDSSGSASAAVWDKASLLYRVMVYIRPDSSRWNIGGGGGNFSEYEYSRMWNPIYFIDGRLGLNGSLDLILKLDIKPAGIFNMSAQFWGITARVGIKYML